MTERRKRNPWLSVGVLVFSALAATFNETSLNVALLPIAEDMNVGTAAVQWLITGYMLVTAVMVPVTAFLYQSIPTKKLYTGAMLIILAGTAGCFFSLSFPALLAFRMIQAVGTGMMIPIMMNTVLLVAPKEKTGTAMALCVCGITLGPAFGPSISGIVVQFFSWRAIFILIMILVAAAILLGIFALENVAELTKPHLDLLSVVFSTAGLALFLYGISIVMSSTAAGLILIAAGAAILAAFVLRQKKLEEPMINLRPFSDRKFTLGLIMVSLAMLVNFSLNAVMPSFLQGALGVSSMVSALLLLPGVLLNAVSTNISGRILDRYGAKIMIPAGFLLFSAALFALSRCGTGTGLAAIVIIHIIICQGLAFSMSPSQTSALSALTPDLNPHGVAIVNTFMQIAAGVGSSLLGGIQAARQAAALAEGTAQQEAVAFGFSGAATAAFLLGIAGLITALFFSAGLTDRRKDRKEVKKHCHENMI